MNIKELLALLKTPVEPEEPIVETVTIPKDEYDAFIELQSLIESNAIEKPQDKPLEEPKKPVENDTSELVKIKKEMEMLRATIAKKEIQKPTEIVESEGVFKADSADDMDLANFLNAI